MRESAILLLAMIFMLSACSSEKNKDQTASTPIPVKIGTIKRVQDRETITVSGTVASPDAPANVAFLVSGKVIQVGPREGEYVRKGQRLATIDPTDYALSAQAAAAQVEQARVMYERSRDEFRRMKMLYDSQSLAPNDFQKFKAAYESAQQQLDQAVAQTKIVRKRLSDATLYAPIKGFISKRSVEPGEMAGPGRPVFEIVQLDPVEISVGVPETDVHTVKIGQSAEIKVPALPEESFTGTVRVINVSADPGTRTYMTRITVANSKHTLRVGMVALANIRGDRILNISTLPGEAVVRDQQGATEVFVYYPDQRRVYAKRVEVGTVHGREIEIKSGLSGNESIVVAGQGRLRDGVVVSAIPADASAGTVGAAKRELH
ncbi:MAG: efflux RND transporter periplasmic adaptor subunit [Desulfuromonadales bacterium]|nr:efflux RND transporter periplasmic adaptor subunit [Desulfuromonadales bacterium]